MGNSTPALAFTVSDAVTPAISLAVTGVSSNTALVPTTGIVLTGPNAQGLCALTVTPKSVYSGITTMTLTVKNGSGLTAKSSFILTVNAKPTISGIGGQVVHVGQATAALPFTVGDDVTAAASLTIKGVATNPLLAPTVNIVFGGSGGQRTVTVTPAIGQNGATTITLTVTDAGGLTATSSFLFTVNGPTITAIANQSVNLNTATAALAFSVGDNVTAAATLTVSGLAGNSTLFPTSRIVFGGSGAARTVMVTPGAGQSGTASITLTVKDGSGITATTSFVVTVNAPPTISTIYPELINMGTATGALSISVGDDLTPLVALSLTCVSSNTALVKAAGITLIAPDMQGNCSVQITPVATYSGSTTITLTVKDGGGLTTKMSFTLTVNGKPTISTIATQAIFVTENTPALAFTINDDLTAWSALTVSGTSSNTLLATSNYMFFGGVSNSRTVIVMPAMGQSGTTTITLTVTDGGGLTATSKFTLIVIAKNPTDGADLVWVPGGRFTMGSAYGDAVSPSTYTQEVKLSSYWVYKNLVTVSQYLTFCNDTQHALPAFPGIGYSWAGKDWTDATLQQHPIVDVNMADIQAYAAWAGVQVITEAQYEYAARGPGENNFPWGGTATDLDPNNGWDQTKCANEANSQNVGISTWPVGSFPAGVSWCGALDMAGNVFEICADWSASYSDTPILNPTGPATGTMHICRGGSWDSAIAYHRGAYRLYTPTTNYIDAGFRCVSF